MRTSVVIASRNEGSNLLRTVRSIREADGTLDLEVVVVDDGSTDDSVAMLLAEFGDTVVVRHEQSVGVSPSRADGVAAATGEVLVFFDAHVKPEPNCIARLTRGIERTNCAAVMIPMVTDFNAETWEPDSSLRGFGFEVTLDRCEARWIGRSEMRERRLGDDVYFESPTVVGCSVAVHRTAYEHIMGFDAGMRTWGMEDVDFGIRAWMTGHPVLCDPSASVAHRFITEFTAYSVRHVDLGANQIRMARKLLSDGTFSEWLAMRGLESESSGDDSDLSKYWRAAWNLYREGAPTLKGGAEALKSRRVMDEFAYAERFNLSWPARRAS